MFKCRFLAGCSLKKEAAKKELFSPLDKATVQQAGLELRQAYQVLSEVEDPDMVDYAVFTVQAAEKRYGYLVRRLKEQEKQAVSVHCVRGDT
ncbi:Uncharacterized [Syntrophomonas zehnderi OL-4]|uniref:Uncharacterized n=1 Tax=Syntrophomonas zehnderi OL-4 TaxID=690567 RepID=A0A0E4G9T8_9FIRM|nr:hypothetical protein [Syntrophomonas zehnderi]CFX23336.1 Uncharacterized [Syntrophomonas zehnderi OL-4]